MGPFTPRDRSTITMLKSKKHRRTSKTRRRTFRNVLFGLEPLEDRRLLSHTSTWTGALDGNYNEEGNWSCAEATCGPSSSPSMVFSGTTNTNINVPSSVLPGPNRMTFDDVNFSISGADISIDSSGTGEIIVNAPSATIDAEIVVGRSVEKLGTGTLRLGGANTYTTATNVNAGRVDVLGSLAGPVNVNSTGTLGGTGTINDSMNVNSGGTLAPGTSPGILQTASVTFASGSTFDVEMGGTTAGNGSGFHDQLSVTGTVNLGGATLNLASFGGFTPTSGDQFVIIDNDGADTISGTFSGLSAGSVIPNFLGSGFEALVSYHGGDGNDMVLTVQPSAMVKLNEDFVSGAGGDVFDFQLAGDGSRTVWISDTDMNDLNKLFSRPTDKSGPQVLVHDPFATGLSGDVFEFKLTADGSRAVWLADADTNGVIEIYSRAADGTGPQVKLNDAFATSTSGDVADFVISKDGSRVVWRADADTNEVMEVYSRATDGSGTQAKLNDVFTSGTAGDAFTIQVNANGTRAAWLADGEANTRRELYGRATDGSGSQIKFNATPVTSGDVDLDFQFTPDGTRIVWRADADRNSTYELFTRLADGSDAQAQINDEFTATGPGGISTGWQISSNGARIVWIADAEARSRRELYSRAVDGSGAQVKINEPLAFDGDVTHLLISPDSSRVAWREDEVPGPFQDGGVFELFSRAIDASSTEEQINADFVSGILGDVLPNFQFSADSSRLVWVADSNINQVFEVFSRPADASGPQIQLNSGFASGTDGDALTFQITPDRSQVVWRADANINETYELFRRHIDGGDPQIQITDPDATLTNGDVVADFLIAASPSTVVFRADPETNNVFELFTTGSSVGATTTVNLDGSNNLLIQDTDGGDTDDTLTISTNGTHVTVSDPNATFTTGIAGATGDGTSTLVVPLTAFTGNIVVDTLAGDDTLTIDLSAGNFTRQIIYDGGAQGAGGDTLTLTGGGTFATVSHTVIDASSGIVNVAGNSAFTYSGLEPVDDNLSATDRAFEFTGAAETITLSDDSDAGDGESLIDSTLGESIAFTNPTNSLTIETSTLGGTGADTINVEGLDSNWAALLTINGDSDDTLNFQTAATSLGGGALDISANAINLNQNVVSEGATIEIMGVTTTSLTVNATLHHGGSDAVMVEGNLNGSGQIANSGGRFVIQDTAADHAVVNFGGDIDDLGVDVGATTVFIDADLTVNDTLFITSLGSLQGAGRINVSGDITSTDADGFAGGTEVAMVGSATTSFVGPNNTALQGLLAVNKTNSTDVAQLGANTGFDAVLVEEGIFDIQSFSSISPVTIEDGGTLRGTGDVGVVIAVQSGGTVAPGASPGMLTTGDVFFTSGSAFDVEIGGHASGTGAGFHDQLNVTGTVDLGGASLNLSAFGGFTPSGTDQHVIVNNDGTDPVSGTFAGLLEGATVSNFLVPNRDAVISYQGGPGGNDVVISTVPADVCWKEAVDGNWNDPTKWDLGFVPAAGDNACINVTGPSAYTVTLDATVAAADALGSFLLDSSGATFASNSNTFSVDGASDLNNGAVSWTSSTWAGSGSVDNNVTFSVGGSSVISAALVQDGTVEVDAAPLADASLTVASGFTNNGLIELRNASTSGGHSSTLIVSSGTLTNSATGEIRTSNGPGSRILNADIANLGSVNIDHTTNYTKANGTITNNGAFDIAAGQPFAFTGASQTFVQAGGPLEIAGTLTMSNDTFHSTGSSITGGGDAILTDSTVLGVGTAAVDFHVAGADVDLGTAAVTAGILNVVEDSGTSTGGDYTQASTTALNIEIGGSDPGTGFDQLNIEGTANLEGTIHVSSINGFVPDPCQVFEIVTFGSRAGTGPSFTGLDLGGGLFFRPVFTANSLLLVAYNNATPINIHTTSVRVTEDGAAATYSVCLAAATSPTGIVTVNISPNPQVTADLSVLTFDPATNWNLPLEVTVTAVDDPDIEGPHAGIISHTSTSNDPLFDGVAISDVTANITDNDMATISFALASSSASEAAGSHALDVVLNIAAGGMLRKTVTVDVADLLSGTASVGNDYSFPTQTATFDPGDTDGTIATASLTVLDDAHVEADETLNVELTNLVDGTGGQVTVISPDDHEVTILDDDGSPGVRLINGALRITGSDETDIVRMRRRHNDVLVKARFDGGPWEVAIFPLSDVLSINVMMHGGNDHLQIRGSVRIPATVDGGAGNDWLQGTSAGDTIIDLAGNNRIRSGAGDDVVTTGPGNDRIWSGGGDDLIRAGGGNDRVDAGRGNDIVLGEAGRDWVAGGGGRDLLISGLDRDVLLGGGSDDILIGGTTDYDATDSALRAILGEWTSNSGYLTRVRNIRSGGGSLAGTGIKLEAGVTVHDDGESDTLKGDSGRDWFFADVDVFDDDDDRLLDRRQGEILDEL